jgi:ATP-dependent exoDNAse (exonuclease V) alpha subunit
VPISARAGGHFLDRNTVLVVDEAGLLSSRQMHDLLAEVEQAGAKAVLVGDSKQLQAVGSGAGLAILASVTDPTRVDSIVRQHDAWAREAVTDFANGRAAEGLQAYRERGLLTTAAGEKLAIRQLVDAWAATQQVVLNPATLLIAKTNAQVRALNEEVRARLKASGQILGDEITISAVTPSGHGQALNLAMGDRIRFLVRQDRLAVINGTTATITHIDAADAENPSISVVIGDRLVTFSPSDLADEHGRARLGHAYATTIYGCQGLTTDRAFVLLDPAMNRHDIYVAASRARIQTQHFLSSKECDAHLKLELPLSERRGAVIDQEARMAWLAARLARAQVKTCTLDPTLEFAARSRVPEREQSRGYDRG